MKMLRYNNLLYGLQNLIPKIKMLFCSLIMILPLCSIVFATEADGKEMMRGVIKVVSAIVMIVGALFCVVGIVKIAIAHAENQGPEQQKAAMMLATGIVLCILPIILNSLGIPDLIVSAIKAGGGSTDSGLSNPVGRGDGPNGAKI